MKNKIIAILVLLGIIVLFVVAFRNLIEKKAETIKTAPSTVKTNLPYTPEPILPQQNVVPGNDKG